MALIKSTILAQISGSINGTTFAHNQGGAYARNRSMVSNPRTDRQEQVRTAMTSLSKMWGASLTEAQRADWRAYGGAVSVVNRVGDTIQLSGIAAFNRVNLFRVGTLGESVTMDPPALPGTGSGDTIPALISTAFTNDATQITADITTSVAATDYGFVVWYSAPLSPGVRFYRGPYAGFVLGTGGPDVTSLIGLPDVPLTGEESRALKITMYETTSGLPVWTVYQDPSEVPGP